MAKDFDLNDYIPVAERVAAFYERHPDGRIQAGKPEVFDVGGKLFVWCQATAWRAPDDPLPAIASAWEEFPGPTPFTKNSEAMNAETSAIGRVLAMTGIEVKRGMASREDVQRAHEDDLTVSNLYVDEYQAKAAKAGLTAFDVEEIVMAVTDGRSVDVRMVRESERPALVERTRVVVAQKAPEGPQTAVEHGNSPDVAGEAPRGVWAPLAKD